jgi:uncharacterized phage protein gp47/JayE
MTQLTSLGFLRSRLDERLANLQDAIRGIFGNNINLDADTVDGETLGIFAEAQSDLDQLAEDVYNSFSPSTASGVALSRIVQYNGITRIAGAYSTVTLLCVGSEGTVIPAGSLVRSDLTLTAFETTAEATIGSTGEVEVEAQATDFGPFIASAGTLTKIDTPIYGWQTVTNETDAVPGRYEETDAELRIRRRISTSTPGTNTVDSIFGAILQIPQVLQARVYENDQDVVQPVTGLPPHSIYCVVEGGEETDIAQTIWRKKSAGVTTVGDILEITPDSQGNPHEIRFSRPDYVDVYIVINLTTRTGWPTDGADRIKAALASWGVTNQEIGEELIQSRLFDPCNTVPGHSITDLFIGTDPAPATETDISVPFDGLARIDTSRITVNVL